MEKLCELVRSRSVQVFRGTDSSFCILVSSLLIYSVYTFAARSFLEAAIMHTSYYMLVIAVLNLATCRTREVYSNTWVAKVDGGLREAERIAREKDLTLLGQVGETLIHQPPVSGISASKDAIFHLRFSARGNSTYPLHFTRLFDQ